MSWAEKVEEELGDPVYTAPTQVTPATPTTPTNPTDSGEAEGSNGEQGDEPEGSNSREGEEDVYEGYDIHSRLSDTSSHDESAEKDDAEEEDDEGSEADSLFDGPLPDEESAEQDDGEEGDQEDNAEHDDEAEDAEGDDEEQIAEQDNKEANVEDEAPKPEENYQQSDQPDEPQIDDAYLQNWCHNKDPDLLDDGALKSPRFDGDEIIPTNNNFLSDLPQPHREPKPKPEPVFNLPPPTAITPAQLQRVEQQRDAARAAEHRAHLQFQEFVAKREGEYRWAKEGLHFNRIAMFEAFKERKLTEQRLATAEQERNTFEAQFRKAKPYVIAEKERQRKLEQNNVQAGTQTQDEEFLEPAPAENERKRKLEEESRDASTQTDRFLAPHPARKGKMRKLEEDGFDSGGQTDALQSGSVDLTMYEARMKLVRRIQQWLAGLRRRSVGSGNNMLPSTDRLSDLLSNTGI